MEAIAAIYEPDPPLSKAQRRYHILINADSGTALRLGRQAFHSMADSTDLAIESYDFIPSKQFNARLAALAQSDYPVLIGGGDGTIAHAAALHLDRDKPFGILPMGTMNLLARDLNLPLIAEGRNIFDYYTNTRVQPIDVGMANDRVFLCCAAIGTIPQAAIFREKTRRMPDLFMMPRLTAYVIDRMDRKRMRSIHMLADDREISLETSALVISNNRFAHYTEAAHKLAKSSLQDGMLGIYSASPQTLYERIRLLLRLQQGRMETEPSLQEFQARTVYIKTNRKRELVSIDGEPVMMRAPLTFKVLSGALKIITPVREEGKPH